MDKRGQKFVVEDLYFRNFDGTDNAVYVDSEAMGFDDAKEWAIDGLREWAAGGISLVAGRADNYFADIARAYARHFYWPGALDVPPVTGDPSAAIKSLGRTLDFLYFFSKRDTLSVQMYPSKPGTIGIGTDLVRIYLWVFADKSFLAKPGTKAAVNIPAHLGMHSDYWEGDTTGKHPLAGRDPFTGTWPEDDQTHHFAGYFALAAGAQRSLFNEELALALRRTNDYPGPPALNFANAGDYFLGVLAADLGNMYRQQPGYYGDLIEQELAQPWATAFVRNGRAITDLP
jgi:hypothetical protein